MVHTALVNITTGCRAAGITLDKPTLAHLIGARARKAAAGEIPVTVQKLYSVRNEQVGSTHPPARKTART